MAAPRRMIVALALDGASPSPAIHGALAGIAEAASIDLLLAGYPGAAWPFDERLRLDPLSVIASLIPQTRQIGLGAVVPVAGWPPFNVARAFSALDNLSRGRAAWFAAPGEDLAADPGRERFAEHLQTTFELWGSWDEGALVFDKARAVFAERERVRRIAHAGRHFTVDGPLNSPRPPQGRPVVLQAWPEDGAGGARHADLLVAPPGANRPPGPAHLLSELSFNLSREGSGSPGYAGDAAGLAELMLGQIATGGCDGFLLRPVRPTADLAAYAAGVAPILRAQGVLGGAGEGCDLRQRLGLSRPPAWAGASERIAIDA